MKSEITDQFITAGMSRAEAQGKARLFHAAASFLERWSGRERASWISCYVPGRIEVLGKHTDYAGGRSLLCSVERGICAIAAPRSDHVIRIADALREQECQFTMSPDLDPQSENWAIYPKTVARRIACNFPGALSGIDMVFASDLPRAAGMSSSSALLIATYFLLERFNDLRKRREHTSNIRNQEELATYLGCVENGQTFGTLTGDAGVGTFGGSQDHTAILCSRPGALRQYRFCPARFEREVPLPPEHTFVVGVSGVTADKTGNAREKYNLASGAAREILKICREATGRTDATLFDAATYASGTPDRIREMLRKTTGSSYSSQTLLDRFEQFFQESTQIVPGATEALNAKDLDMFGKLVDRSQELAERKLGNQVSQTMELARSARAIGAIAASAFGAGFGGSVWAMVHVDQVAGFLNRWQDHYRNKFPPEADKSAFFVSGAGPATSLF
jgi:galactokinase